MMENNEVQVLDENTDLDSACSGNGFNKSVGLAAAGAVGAIGVIAGGIALAVHRAKKRKAEKAADEKKPAEKVEKKGMWFGKGHRLVVIDQRTPAPEKNPEEEKTEE